MERRLTDTNRRIRPHDCKLDRRLDFFGSLHNNVFEAVTCGVLQTNVASTFVGVHCIDRALWIADGESKCNGARAASDIAYR